MKAPALAALAACALGAPVPLLAQPAAPGPTAEPPGGGRPFAALALDGHAFAAMTAGEKLRYLEGFLAASALRQAAEAGTTVDALRREQRLEFPFSPTVYKTRLEDFLFYRDRRDLPLHEALARVNAQLRPSALPSPR
jgi:hypothetical protein